MRSRWLAVGGLAVLCGCAHTNIEGTQVPGTVDNRVVFAQLEKMRLALEARDAAGILAVVSPKYFEDNGTPTAADDFGYEELKTRILPESLAATKEMSLTFEVHEIVVDDERAHADIRYHSRARLELPSGTLWDTHDEFNRVELSLENGEWLITTGL